MMPYLFAFFSALSAAAVAILSKLGLRELDSTLATIIRSIIMALFLLGVGFITRKFQGFHLGLLNQKDWILIILAGIAGAVSWLFYFAALKYGVATKVAAIDRLSIVFVIILAALFLGESLTWKSIAGALLMAFGAVLITLK